MLVAALVSFQTKQVCFAHQLDGSDAAVHLGYADRLEQLAKLLGPDATVTVRYP